jgi:hypothetical protein
MSQGAGSVHLASVIIKLGLVRDAHLPRHPPRVPGRGGRCALAPQAGRAQGAQLLHAGATQRAFNLDGDDKMDHNPVIFLRAAPGCVWQQIDDFPTSEELLAEVRELVAAH